MAELIAAYDRRDTPGQTARTRRMGREAVPAPHRRSRGKGGPGSSRRLSFRGHPKSCATGVPRIAPVPGFEERFDPALLDPFIEDISRNAQDLSGGSGAVSPANVEPVGDTTVSETTFGTVVQ